MSEISNFQKAKEEADRVDQEIIQVLKEDKSFRVEAGAGSGKTYSLNRVIEWIQANKWTQFKKQHQQVACLTYTNVAVDVISSRLKTNSFIVPSTIHSFAWGAIKQYQNFLIEYIKATESMHLKDEEKNSKIESINKVEYELGYKYIKDNVLYVSHNNVIDLFVRLLDEPKFRLIFSSKYPLILIDEYQDSFKAIIDKFKEHFISKNKGSQFGFFGDEWQTIYQINKPCGLIEDNHIVAIKKGSNFRSAPKIVDVLNIIRPSLPQISAIDGIEGEVTVVNCNDYDGVRREDKNFKNELPVNEINSRLTTLENILYKDTSKTFKTLMITHIVLAQRQGYVDILDVLGNDKFKENEEKIFKLFAEIVEPIFEALDTSNSELLFQILGIKRYPITKKQEKLLWNKLKEDLKTVRKYRAIDVLKIIINNPLVPIPDEIVNLYTLYNEDTTSPYYESTLEKYLEIEYKQFCAAIAFHHPNSIYSTDHGIKGEEYDNVIFVISKGWNNYQFDVYAPMVLTGVTNGKEDSFVRNRNLFYVCCSRPKEKLLIFVTAPVEQEFENFLKKLVGNDNYYMYDEYINKVRS